MRLGIFVQQMNRERFRQAPDLPFRILYELSQIRRTFEIVSYAPYECCYLPTRISVYKIGNPVLHIVIRRASPNTNDKPLPAHHSPTQQTKL